MRIFVGIPTYDRRLDIELFKVLIDLDRLENYNLDFMFPVSSHIARNRNMIVHEMLKGGYDALLFLDSDIGISDATFLDKMMETAYKFDAKIVGGAYRMKKPADEIVYVAGEMNTNYKKIPYPQLCEFVGTGIMLVFREVFEKVGDPWFSIIDKPLLECISEDYEFCRRAKEEGFNVAIDPRFSTRHFGTFPWEHNVV